MDRERQSLIVGAHLLHLICEANGGRQPETIWEYRRVARRFGVRIRVLPPGVPGGMLRQGRQAGEQGVIYVRRTHDMERFRCELLHELAEAACRWEGTPPWVCQTTHHEAARAALDIKALMRHPALHIDAEPDRAMPSRLTEAQRELLDVYRTQLELWQAQVELSDKQTDLFRELAERLMPTGEGES